MSQPASEWTLPRPTDPVPDDIGATWTWTLGRIAWRIGNAWSAADQRFVFKIGEPMHWWLVLPRQVGEA